jgi:hypothetical protein
MALLQQVARCAALAAILTVVGICAGTAPAEDDGAPNAKFPQHVLIVRHAEKTTDKDNIHLSPKGKERALLLDKLFTASKDRPDPFPMPDFIFAAAHHADSRRPVDTVTPLAGKLKLPINFKYDSKLPAALDKEKPAKKEGMRELRDEIFGSPKYCGKTILVAWRHKTIADLATALKASKVPPKWEDNVFDRVWQITYDDQGNATFRDRPQRLLPGDAEK